jgi:hypothetical protein
VFETDMANRKGRYDERQVQLDAQTTKESITSKMTRERERYKKARMRYAWVEVQDCAAAGENGRLFTNGLEV